MRKLRDMEIDEISLVDRAANQHASILFSKSLTEEADMPDAEELYLFDADGQPVDTDDLEFGDVVFSEDGEELVIVPDDTEDAQEYELDEELEPVGKGTFVVDAAGAAKKAGSSLIRSPASQVQRGKAHEFKYGWKYGKDAPPHTREGTSLVYRTGGHISRNRGKYAAGAGGAAFTGAGAGGYAMHRRHVEKSLGEALVEELSKSDRDERELQLASALGDEIEKAQAAADEAYAYAEQLEDERATEAFISKAAEYNLPVDPVDLGLILKAAATVLDDDQLELLDQLFEAIGDDIYDEIGAVGDTDNNDVLSQVDRFAEELVGKSDGSLSMAEASTLLFEQNPEAYEMYLRENGGV
jgi:hypothetical protein